MSFFSSIGSALNTGLDFLFGWTLNLPPFLGILALAAIIIFVTNLIYKYTTDQSLMKSIKEQLEDYKKKAKAERANPKKAMKIQSEMMELSMKQMRSSFRSMIWTIIPVLLVINWMAANYTYAPMDPAEALLVDAKFHDGFTGEARLHSATLNEKELRSTVQQTDDENIASFAVTGPPGVHNFSIRYEDLSVETEGFAAIGEKPKQNEFAGKGPVDTVTVNYPRIRPLGGFHIGSWYPGWLAVYFILSIFLSIYSRKLMKIY